MPMLTRSQTRASRELIAQLEQDDEKVDICLNK